MTRAFCPLCNATIIVTHWAHYVQCPLCESLLAGAPATTWAQDVTAEFGTSRALAEPRA